MFYLALGMSVYMKFSIDIGDGLFEIELFCRFRICLIAPTPN
jgi:hypothetical protein